MEQLSIAESCESESTRNYLESAILSINEDTEELSDEIIQIFEDESVKIHRPASLPMPFGIEEKNDEIIFIDPASGEGKRILSDSWTEISELFAVLRQFVSPACDNIGFVITEMLNRKVGVNDIDSITGMSMLHYVIRAESIATDKLGPAEAASVLLSYGADPSQRTIFTDMNAFHLAAFFDCSLALETMINNSATDVVEQLVNSLSSEFDFGTPLHIATANLSVNAAEVLIKHGADLLLRDDSGNLPENCIPSRLFTNSERKQAERLRDVFREKELVCSEAPDVSENKTNLNMENLASETKMTDQNANFMPVVRANNQGEFSVGDFVVVGESKRGVIRFIGTTKFAPGVWCGIELDEHIGKNDGSINGVRYFTCERTRGVFAPSNKLARASPNKISSNGTGKKDPIHDGEKTRKRSRTNQSFRDSSGSDDDSCLHVGMNVYVNHLREEGKIRYIGETDFASGVWVGLSLRRPIGKNNGTIQGRCYFQCKKNCGIMLHPSRISVNGVNGEILM